LRTLPNIWHQINRYAPSYCLTIVLASGQVLAAMAPELGTIGEPGRQSDNALISSITPEKARPGDEITIRVLGAPAEAFAPNTKVHVALGALTVVPRDVMAGEIIVVIPDSAKIGEQPLVQVRFDAPGMTQPLIVKSIGKLTVQLPSVWEKFLRNPQAPYLMVNLLGFLVLAYLVLRMTNLPYLGRILSKGESAPPADVANPAPVKPTFNLPSAVPSDQLIKAIGENDVVLFAGGGLSIQAGLPGWRDVIAQLVDKLATRNEYTKAQINELRMAMAQGEHHYVADQVVAMIGSNNQLMVEYRDDFSVKNGPGTNTFGARWAYFF